MKKTSAARCKSILLGFIMLAPAICAARVSGQTTQPKRFVVLSRYSESVKAAESLFEKKYGAGLIEVETGESEIALDKLAKADVVVFHYLSGAVFQKYAVEVKAAAARGAIVMSLPGDNMERFWNLKADPKLLPKAENYWTNGGADNLASFLAMMYRAAGGKLKAEVSEAQTQAAAGIYHPRSKEPFANLADYLRWYRAQKIVPENAPLAAVLFFSNNYKFKDLAHIDAIVARLEKAGIGAVPAFGYPLKNLRAQLNIGEKSPVRVILALSLGFSKQDDVDELERYGVPVINLMTTRMSEAEWIGSIKGIEPERLPNQLNAPERAGANEPTLVATTEKVEGSEATRTQPVAERVDLAVRRARRWLVLQDKPNAEKHIGFIYYSNPPGKGYLGASYLNLMPSLIALVKRLKAEGYDAGDGLPDEKQLIEILHKSGRNIEQWAPGELDEMAKRGNVTLMPVSRYRELYQTLPAEFRAEVERVWGMPEKSNLMTLVSGGQKQFVLPGVRFGNVFLGPQPLRSTFERATQVQHDTLTPPPHSYIAAYLWYRYEFKADAVVHMGRHGTLEWLPGKQVGQAGADSSEALLGDLPNPYYFIIDGGGEAIQARRRAAGVMIGHLTPLIVPGGEQAEYAALHEALEQYEKTIETSPPLAEEYKKQVVEQFRFLKLDKQLGIDLKTVAWEKIYEAADGFIHDTEADPTPMGQATIGSLPSEAIQREALENFISTAFRDEELKAVKPYLKEWADALFDGKPPVISNALAPKLQSKANTAIADGKLWLENLRRSPEMELDAIVKVLSGRYLTSGLLGDPLRNAASIPSGRNLHDFDTSQIPTKAAWELGKKMATQTIERYKRDTGKMPEKVSMVLWYGETGRNHGAMESEAMYLMGVEPKWNTRGVVDGLRLISDAELGRPRVDVILTISGIYRDGFGDKVLWLDRAARLAATAPGNNAISRHDREVAETLKRNGVASEKAETVAQARVFGSAPGEYGVGGVGNIVEQSLDEGKEKGLAEMYLHHMNNAYSDRLWGENVPQALNLHLRGNQVVIHSRTTNVYGLLDNDDSYQFAGGLNIATKSVNAGEIPQFYVNNMRLEGREKVEDFRTFLVKELSTRYWNPKWIKEQQNAGYAGARQFVKEMEHLYGWQATSKEQVDGELWQKSFDVYVADKNGLKMDEFFEQANPYARQWQLARMLEVDKQGTYKYSDADRAALVERYVKSVIKHGASCSANTCGNAKLHEFIAENARAAGISNEDLQRFAGQMAKSTNWNARDFAAAPAAFQAGLVQGLGREAASGQPQSAVANQPPAAPVSQNQPSSSAAAAPRSETIPGANNGEQAARKTDSLKPSSEPKPAQNKVAPADAPPVVSGYTLEEKIVSAANNAVNTISTNPIAYLIIFALVLGGLLWEWRKRSI